MVDFLSLVQCKLMLNKPIVRKDIQDLHDNSVITPVDKAAHNFVVVWKMFYV